MKKDMVEAGDLAAALTGRWRLMRRVADRFAGEMTLEGWAAFGRSDRGLSYDEEGRWADGPMRGLTARRRDLWTFPAPGSVAVMFGDGRPFHRFEIAMGRAGAEHPCGPDLYRVRYRFDLPRGWRTVWRVTGPRKDYEMTSDYTR